MRGKNEASMNGMPFPFHHRLLHFPYESQVILHYHYPLKRFLVLVSWLCLFDGNFLCSHQNGIELQHCNGRKIGLKGSLWCGNPTHTILGLFVVIDDGIHEIHHRLGGTEHALHLVEPLVALVEIIRQQDTGVSLP